MVRDMEAQMQSKPKANSIITSAYNAERNTITFTVLGYGDVELDLNKVSAENFARAAIHGFNQRIPDAAAIGTLDADGNVIPKAERTRIKYERMNDLCRFYESGTTEWSRVGQGGGSRSITIEAIARCKDWTYETAEDEVTRYAERKFNGDRKKALAKLGGDPLVREAIREIRAERDAARGDANAANAILDELTQSGE